jgi:uncharacterized protein (TIGR02391 family)
MYELQQAIPDVDTLLKLEPEELSAKLLFLLRKRKFQMDMFILSGLESELWPISYYPGQQTAYPQNRRDEISLALSEAFAWLEAQGLIVPAGGGNGQHGWRMLSRRAKRFESEQEFANYAVARLLPKDMLHPKISEMVWMAFMRGEFDVAVFQAMKAVEVEVRDATALGNQWLGTKLMCEAFRDNGPLTDMSADAGERVARMQLFAGAIGSYKNPQSHRDVNLDDPKEAVEIILLANHLLRIVDARKSSCTKVAQQQIGLGIVKK